MKQPNLLILDEPTNDLDIVTLNILEEYLKEFKGTLVIVSHDRHFLDRLVDHLFVFCGDGVVKDFIGGYSEYRSFMKDYEAEQRRAAEAQKKAGRCPVKAGHDGNAKAGHDGNAKAGHDGNVKAGHDGNAKAGHDGNAKAGHDGNAKAGHDGKGASDQSVIAGPDRQSRRKLTWKEQRELEQLEKDMEELNAEKDRIEALLSGGTASVEEIAGASARFGEVKDLLDEKEMRWLELSEIAEG